MKRSAHQGQEQAPLGRHAVPLPGVGARRRDVPFRLRGFRLPCRDSCICPNPAAAWRKVHAAQKRMCDFLNKAREVRFVSPNGTDLTVGVAGRTWINCDGSMNFPDGEVFTGPIETATEGIVKYSFPAIIRRQGGDRHRPAFQARQGR